VWTPDDVAVAAGHSVDPAGWRVLFDELMSRVAGRFARVEPRRTAREFVLGLLPAAERKNCWWLAGQAGHRDPQAMQRLLRTAVGDADAVRDDLRAFAVAHLGDAAGVLICDETGFLKKGISSAGPGGVICPSCRAKIEAAHAALAGGADPGAAAGEG